MGKNNKKKKRDKKKARYANLKRNNVPRGRTRPNLGGPVEFEDVDPKEHEEEQRAVRRTGIEDTIGRLEERIRFGMGHLTGCLEEHKKMLEEERT